MEESIYRLWSYSPFSLDIKGGESVYECLKEDSEIIALLVSVAINDKGGIVGNYCHWCQPLVFLCHWSLRCNYGVYVCWDVANAMVGCQQ